MGNGAIGQIPNNSWSMKLARELDAADGKHDGKINADIWNGFIKKVGSKGNKINRSININRAALSFNFYEQKKDVGSVDWMKWQEMLEDYKMDLGLTMYRPKIEQAYKHKPAVASVDIEPDTPQRRIRAEVPSSEIKPVIPGEPTEPDAPSIKVPQDVPMDKVEMKIPSSHTSLSVEQTAPSPQTISADKIVRTEQPLPRFDIETEVNKLIEENDYKYQGTVNGISKYKGKNKKQLEVAKYANGNTCISEFAKSGKVEYKRIVNSAGFLIRHSEFIYPKKKNTIIEIRNNYHLDGTVEKLYFLNRENVEKEVVNEFLN